MKRYRARLGLRTWLYSFAVSSLVLAGCDLGSSSGDAGASSGSGTVLSSTCMATTYSACGGDVTGTWGLDSICAETSTNPVDVFNRKYSAFPDCGSLCSAASMTASGFVKYSAQTMSSSLAVRVVASLSLNSACFTEAAGSTLSDSTCQSYGGGSNSASNCSLMLSNCNCQYDQTTYDNATSYALSGNQIVEYDNTLLTPQTIDYCVSGLTMTQRRNMAPGISSVLQFTRRQ